VTAPDNTIATIDGGASLVGEPNVPAKTPEDWLQILARRLDLRRNHVNRLRQYVDGNAPLPEMSDETKEAWQRFQRKSRTNWGELIVSSVVDRVVPNGITVNGDPKHPKAKLAQKIYRDNRMDSVIKDWLRAGLTFAQSYMTAWRGTDGKPVITADSPETFCVITNPLQKWRPIAALRVWRTEELARDYAMVWTDGVWTQFSRPTYTSVEHKVIPTRWLTNLAEGSWTRIDTGTSIDIPVVVYNNPDSAGEFEYHTDLIDRINAGILERLVIVAMQAFRQRALTGGMLPEKDEQGNSIDYSKVFAPAPGALWNLPAEMEIWESQQIDTGPILNASKDDVRQLSAVTRTPLPMLMPDSANTSAEGARSAENGYIFRCKDRCNEAKLGAIAILVTALAMAGEELADDETLDVSFEPVERITLAEKYTAAYQAKQAGESIKSIQRNVLGYSPDQIAQDSIDRAQDALIAASFAPPQQQALPPGQNPQRSAEVQQRNGSAPPAANDQRPQKVPSQRVPVKPASGKP
jgi:hypothetical protein